MAKIIIEVADELKGIEKPIKAFLAEAEAQIRRARRGARVEYEAFEKRLSDKAAAIERRAHGAALAALDVNAPRVLIDGVEHRQVGRHMAPYRTQAGEVAVMRSLYRRADDRNARTVDTVSLRCGALGEGWLPGTARAMAHLLQQGTSREAQLTAQRMGRLPYSRSSFESVGHEVGTRYVARHVEIEAALIERFEVPKEVYSVSVSLDRVSLPMEEPRPRPVGRPRKGAPKKPICRVYRMAYCATVTLHDVEGEAVHTLRYGAMPAGDAATLCMGLAADVEALREKRDLPVSLLCDGAAEMWSLLDEQFSDETVFGPVTRLIDFWHLVEKLAPAARVIHGEDKGLRVLAGWRKLLLNRADAAGSILDELVASGREHVRRGGERPVHDAITYLTNNGHRMNYAAARRRHLPIGSGAVEATCKSLISQRMKRCGARWKTDTGAHVVHLRALSLSDRWDQAMDLTLQPAHAKVRLAA